MQLELSELGRTRYAYGLVELLWGGLPPRSGWLPLYRLLAVVVAACVLITVGLAAAGGPWAAFTLGWFTVLFPINLFIHYRTRQRLSALILSIRYLSKLVTTGHRLATLGLAGLEDVSGKLRAMAKAAKAIPRATALLVPERSGAAELGELVAEYLAILFLVEVRSFYALVERIRACRDDLTTLFETLGQLDAMQSVASFREGLRWYARPTFPTGGLMLELSDAFHPLLTSAVPNSISLSGRGCIVTGSNMSASYISCAPWA